MGRWGQNLHQSVLNSNRIKFTHACTRSPSKVTDYCAANNLALTDDYMSVLQNKDIDAIVLATPHSQHFEQIMHAAEWGKHVYAEKPFTLSGVDADTALRSLAENDLKVGIGHNRRFAPNTQALKAMLDSQELGELVYIDGMFSAQMAGAKGQWRDSRTESPAGGMTSLGIHIVDMFRYLCGEIAEVSASSKRLQTQCAFDDATIVNVKFKAGYSGVLTTLTASPMQWCLRLYGTRGWVEIYEQDTLRVTKEGSETEVHRYPGYDYPALQSIADCLEDFAGSVLNEKPFLIRPDEILHCTQVLEAIIISVDSGEAVSI